MEYGPDVAFYEELASQGSRTPLENYPELLPEHEWYLNCFSRLSGTRSIGFVPNPISYVEYISYFALFPPPYEIDFVIEVLLRMDSAFLDFSRKKIERQNAKKTK